ncbi:bifunctional UDP-N-acetylmuramoyl-tripeptide:D-alanyl-D-alanine ligase/alanine racemase [Marinifilum sp. N1E240]|uniref:bifunctional UDP-N-acetylmuramoyl-tripeptide:D-alanyl-D-alanine ligase/alanine racemase n=1 Tax=Marinifilum sp. N1E240 TaxID=2608082 RepID=UPI00128E8264|nr:bifunctional UDP-N-acetylmuramoyl-tripeptide:D-alanyl-D-alanine ligase/alanine racemase [Marinifilum sp. N1E240]MPQ47589.1 bifunctional UDP-N-acetylmuramoyl-tripeptide:D-alanyl-D-alanine ligase/alanine racemase [Marinifilum sp. N1E240]
MRSDNSYSIESIARIAEGRLLGDSSICVRSLSIDSRSLLIAEQTLFFALVGERHNGHTYIADLYKKGVRAFVISNIEVEIQNYPEAGFVLVENTLDALQQLSKYHREQFSYPVVGITGSNGKTIVKEWLYQLLNESFTIVRSPKSYNSQVGVPLSLWNMNTEAEMAIIEAGISQPNEMSRLAEIIQPNIGVFTHLGEAHRENFTGKLHLIYEKINLFSSCEKVVYCSDDSIVERSFVQGLERKQEHINWSRNKYAYFMILKEKVEGNFTRITYKVNCIENEIVIPFTDHASVDNAITAYVTALIMDVDEEVLKKALLKLEPIAMRLEIKEGFGNCTLINDYYNSDLGSLEIALDFMNRQQRDKKKTLILSDIYQAGLTDRKLYKQVAKLIDKKKLDRFIGIGERISSLAELFEGEASFYPSTDIFLSDLNRNQFNDELILIKGARDFHFERISKALQFKAHRTVLEVDLTAMVHNLNYFRSLLKPETKLTVMVKAFSYGSGSTEIANLLQYHRVDYLAVAIADEGVELRNAGINIPIIVMNPEPHSFETMIEYRLEPEIYNIKILKEFQKALRQNLVKNYPIHIKLDTGMHRMGFMQDDLDELIEATHDNEFFYLRSIFSHLAGADEEQHDDYTIQQIELFSKWSDKIRSHFDYKIDRHVLNSAGIERFSHAQFEMVRLGIGLYGVSPVHQDKLMNVSTLKTTISQIKEVSKENTVGYGRMGVLSEDTRIGIIPIGYADGFSRKLSNGVGKLLVNGTLCPVVGNVCMDMSMIDLTNVAASEGDTVVIFGNEHPVSELAQQLDTIPYEILTTVSRRVKRVYLQE